MSVSVGVCVCPRSYLRNCTSDLHQFFVHVTMAVARSFSDGVVVRYVLPVLWITLHLLIGHGCLTSPTS